MVSPSSRSAGSARSGAPAKKKKPIVALLILAALVLLALLLGRCLGLGTGSGSGESEPADPVPPQPVVTPLTGSQGSDAAPAGGIDARGARLPCTLVLSSAGLRLNGRPATTDEAVQACREAGSAQLKVTGGARTGTYKELSSALGEAGVPVDERQWQEPPSPTPEPDTDTDKPNPEPSQSSP